VARRFNIFAGLILAAAVPAAAHTFGFSPGSAAPACLAIGDKTFRLVRGAADVAVRIDPSAATPHLRIKLADTPEGADFVFVDDGAPPVCATGSNVKGVSIGYGAADIVLGFASGSAPADYSVYVRSRSIAPETAAALFAAANRPPQRIAGGAVDRSN
jgi:hypothetical protein